MDELTLLRNLHRDTPGPSAAETATARARLLDAMADPRSGAAQAASSDRRVAVLRRLARRRLWAPAAAAAAVTAVAITAAAIAAPGPRAAGPGSAPAVPLTAAAGLLQAASAAARQAPGRGRFFVTEFEYLFQTNPPVPHLRTLWIGDGVPGRLASGGQPPVQTPSDDVPFGNSVISWARLRRLPTAPRQLLADIAQVSRYAGRPAAAGTELATIANLLAEAPAPPALRSALYRAAALLPGIRVSPHARDLIGRTATEVYVPGRSGSLGDALFFDRASGAVLAVARLLPSPARCPLPGLEHDVLASGYVGSAYTLPPGAPRAVRPVAQPRSAPACPVTQVPHAVPSPTVSPVTGATPSPTVSPAPRTSPAPGVSPTPATSPTPEPSVSPATSPTPGPPRGSAPSR